MKTESWSDTPYTFNNYSQVSLEPTGFYNYDNLSNLSCVGHSAYFWTNAKAGDLTAHSIIVLPNDNTLHNEKRNKWEGFSVRCVKDIIDLSN